MQVFALISEECSSARGRRLSPAAIASISIGAVAIVAIVIIGT